MRWTRPLLVVLAVALAGWSSLASAQDASAPASLVVDIRDFALVPRLEMTRAIAELHEIFARVGVSVAATLEERPRDIHRAEPRATARPAITVQIYPSLFDDVVSNDPNVLGLVPGASAGGRLVYVFASRIDRVARRNGADYGRLLGIVVAHEIGHVLLSGREHSSGGLMQPTCDARQIRRVMLGTIGFNIEEAATLKARIFP